MRLSTTPNMEDPDRFYQELLATHQGLTEADSHALNAQLILILANHVGGAQALSEALALAREGFS